MKAKTVQFKTVRTVKEIKALSFVFDVWNEGDDGWWISLEDGYVSEFMDCGLVHEHTVRELCNSLNYGVHKVTKV